MSDFETKSKRAWRLGSVAFLALCLGGCAADDVGEPPPGGAEAFAFETEGQAEWKASGEEPALETEPTAGEEAAITPVASAAYNGACGSGYNAIDSRAVPGGTVHLTYSPGTGKNCVVTVRNTPGARLPMNAFVKRSSATVWNQDPGNYTTYAGPVYVYAPGVCIDWGGEINGSGVAVFNSHCN